MKIREYPGGRWQADSGWIGGRRHRRLFDSQKDAKLWLQKMEDLRIAEKLGIKALDPATTADASRALAILTDRISLTEAAQFWSEHHQERAAAKLSTIIEEFKRYLGGNNARPRYVDGIEDTLNAFKGAIGDPMIGDCTTEKILAWLRNPEWSKATFRNRRRELSVFFNWTVKQGMLILNPVARIPSPKLDEGKVKVLTPDQVKNLLTKLNGSDRAYFALATFAGLRPGEIDRLSWGDVRLDRGVIDLSSQQAKSRSRRLVKIEPNLKAWLAPLVGGPEEPISRCDKYEMMKRACHAAGLEEWPQNVCRHSFGSYHLEKFRTINETALQMGHTTTAMLFKHYREVVSAEDAEKFWAIVP
jgi:integrase